MSEPAATVRAETWLLRRVWRVPIALGLAAVVIVTAATRVGNRWLAGVAGALIAVAVSAVWPGRSGRRPRFEVELHGPARTAVGDTVQHELVLRGVGREVGRLRVGILQPGLSSVVVGIPGIPARGVVTIPITRTAERRAVTSAAQLVVTVGTDLNQVDLQQNLTCPAPSIVHPRRLTAPPPPARPRAAGPGGELLGARAFRSGDSPRDIHWRASARHGGLIVAERGAEEPPPELVLVIGRPVTDDDEQLLALAAAIGRQRITRGEPVRVLAWHRNRRLTAPTGSVIALADWFAGLAEPSVPTVEAVLAQAQDAACLTIAASSQTPTAWRELMTSRPAAPGRAAVWLEAQQS